MSAIKVVAEIGCNHNGKIDIAKKLLYEAKLAGADAAKFQLFKTECLVSPSADLAEYQKKNSHEDSQYAMLKKIELSRKDYIDIIAYSKELGIEVFATAFDLDTVDFLAENGQTIWKIPSGEITNLPLLEKIVSIKCDNKEIVLSTGMANLDEIDAAVHILEKSEHTSLTILQCNTQYPTNDEDMNINVLKTFEKRYPKWKIGLSDHSDGIIAALVAVGMGATFIEKHFTLDKNMLGPDHKASITPKELEELCAKLKKASTMLGTQEKRVSESERENITVVRKSIVASCNIKKGELFTEKNLTCKRPGMGMSPMRWHEILGRVSSRDYKENELIVED